MQLLAVTFKLLVHESNCCFSVQNLGKLIIERLNSAFASAGVNVQLTAQEFSEVLMV